MPSNITEKHELTKKENSDIFLIINYIISPWQESYGKIGK